MIKNSFLEFIFYDFKKFKITDKDFKLTLLFKTSSNDLKKNSMFSSLTTKEGETQR